jgi:plastocyanin
MLQPILPVAALIASIVLIAPAGATLRDAERQDPTGTGTIIGHVRLTTRLKGAALPSTAYPTRAVGSAATHALPEIYNVVVYLKDVVGVPTASSAKVQLRQEHETFVPHVLAIQRGATVDFPNDDPIFHNVFSLSSAAAFDLRRYPRGESRSRQFTKAGVVKVYCHLHSHMSATILVLDHPYFTIPETDGTFTLPNLPPGEHVLVGWHERVGERRTTVHVERGKTATVDLSLPVGDPQ